MEKKRLDFDLQIKKADSATGIVEGFGSTFGNIDRGLDIVEPGAFTQTLKDHKANGTMPAMFFNHNSSEPVGEWLEIDEVEKGLFMKGKIWIDEPKVDKAIQAFRMAKSNGMKGLSIGFTIPKGSAEFDENGIRKIMKVNLLEVSLVAIPMNAEAQITAVKSFFEDSGEIKREKEIEAILRKCGLSKSQARGFMSQGYKGLRRDAENDSNEERCDAVQLARLEQALDQLKTIYL